MPTDLTTFLRLAKNDRLKDTARDQRLAGLEAYWLGRQYRDRPLDVNGYRKTVPIYGSAARTPGWNERDPGAVWNLRGEIVGELTDWSLAGDAWCRFEVTDDDAAEDWLNTVAGMVNMGDVMAQARDYGGAMGSAAVSFRVRDGEYLLEAHNPRQCWPLAWRDAARHRPAVVAMVYPGDNILAGADGEHPLLARIWTEVDESLHERVRNPDGSDERWSWREVERVPHGLGFCPFYWHPQLARSGSHEGCPDGEGTEGEIDEANELFAAAGCTTKRNADDTLVVKEDPALNPGTVRKGAFNTIFARNGAEYLSQDGASARICVELAEKRAQHVYRQSGVVLVDVETLKGATTGEALKRLFQRTLKSAATLRRDYAKGLIIPLAQGLLASARRLRGRLLIPPRVEQGEGRTVIEFPRLPGKSSFVQCIWPETFQPTLDDLQKLVAAASAGAGNRQVLSRRAAVTWIASSPIPVSNVDDEIKAIEQEEKDAAERAATSMGLGQLPAGRAGEVSGDKTPPTGEEADDQEQPPGEGERPAA